MQLTYSGTVLVLQLRPNLHMYLYRAVYCMHSYFIHEVTVTYDWYHLSCSTLIYPVCAAPLIIKKVNRLRSNITALLLSQKSATCTVIPYVKSL